MRETDPTLIRAAAAGDLTAFEDIVRCHQQHVWRFLRRLLGDDTAAEDVAQETFLRVYRKLPTFTFQCAFSTWLFQVARNAGVDELRSRQRRTRLAGALSAPGTAPPAGQTRVEIDAALATLPVDLREALLLVEVLGLRYAEAATVLGVPVGTVKSRIFTARMRLARWASVDDERGDEPAAAGEPAVPGERRRSGRPGEAAKEAGGEV